MRPSGSFATIRADSTLCSAKGRMPAADSGSCNSLRVSTTNPSFTGVAAEPFVIAACFGNNAGFPCGAPPSAQAAMTMISSWLRP